MLDNSPSQASARDSLRIRRSRPDCVADELALALVLAHPLPYLALTGDNADSMAWKDHSYRVGTVEREFDEAPADAVEHRREIEPWLSAVFQSEHLSLLVGNGLTTAVAVAAGGAPPSMSAVEFGCELETEVNARAATTAGGVGRGEPNIEDQLRAALELIGGLEVIGDARTETWRSAVNGVLGTFAKSVLAAERSIDDGIRAESDDGLAARSLLISFLLSFASRAASRERLHAFTTNYDRLIEYGCDLVGLRPLDRFVGALAPVFRASLCRPNSTLVSYGYGFGDEHINRVILDMLTIPSTHFVVISYDDCGGRLETFLERASRNPQVSLLIGPHFADLATLVRHYLPKPAIDTLSVKKADLVRRRESQAPTPSGAE